MQTRIIDDVFCEWIPESWTDHARIALEDLGHTRGDRDYDRLARYIAARFARQNEPMLEEFRRMISVKSDPKPIPGPRR